MEHMTATNFNLNTENSDHSSYLEPSFYFGLNKSRKLPAGIKPEHTLNSFEYWLKQKPGDLACHLQRIQFSVSERNKKELFAAICDLFIVLGPLGLPLRQRLFTCYRKSLDQDQSELIDNFLGEKYLTSDMASLPDNCFLKKAPVDLVKWQDSTVPDTAAHEDILHIAESYIENSQFDEALEHMYSHLEQSPDNEELTIKLIDLYKALDYKDKFQMAYKVFSKNLITSRYWSEAMQHFLNP